MHYAVNALFDNTNHGHGGDCEEQHVDKTLEKFDEFFVRAKIFLRLFCVTGCNGETHYHYERHHPRHKKHFKGYAKCGGHPVFHHKHNDGCHCICGAEYGDDEAGKVNLAQFLLFRFFYFAVKDGFGFNDRFSLQDFVLLFSFEQIHQISPLLNLARKSSASLFAFSGSLPFQFNEKQWLLKNAVE